VRRLLILGDSVTAGDGIGEMDRLFPQRLEVILNRQWDLAHWQVFNMGVTGYQTMQEVETLRVKGLQLEPDIVLIAFCVNDFELEVNGGLLTRLRMRNPDYDPDLVPRTPAGRLIENSRLAFVLYHRMRAVLGDRASQYDYRQRHLGGRDPVAAGLELFDSLQREHDFEAVVFAVPSFSGSLLENHDAEIHARLRETLKVHPAIPLWDLTQDFAAIDVIGQRFSTDGIHLNARGHDALARILMKKILSTWPDRRFAGHPSQK
jgi:lysophospholipase L1-like esterase